MNNFQSESNTCLKQVELSQIKVQLKSIRNEVNKLLDILDVNVIPNASVVTSDGKLLYLLNFLLEIWYIVFIESADKVLNTNIGGSNVINKVNSSEFDPLQDKKHGNSEMKEPNSSASNVTHGEGCDSRSQSVPVRPTPTPPVAATVAAANTQYIRTPTTGWLRKILVFI